MAEIQRVEILVCFSTQFLGLQENASTVEPLVTERELSWLLYGRHIYNPYSHPLQPPAFELMGYQRTDGHSILVPDDVKLILCLGCSDRYQILWGPSGLPALREYTNVKDWRLSVDYPFPDQLDDLRRQYEASRWVHD